MTATKSATSDKFTAPVVTVTASGRKSVTGSSVKVKTPAAAKPTVIKVPAQPKVRVSDPAADVKVIQAWQIKAHRYNHAAIAGIAYYVFRQLDGDKLPKGVTQKSIAEKFGIDEGNLSRMLKAFKNGTGTLSAAQVRRAVNKVVLVLEPTPKELDALVKTGEIFKRVHAKPVTADAVQIAGEGAEVPAATTGKNVMEEPDILAALHEWLLMATDGQYVSRVSVITDMITALDDERANNAAAAA